MTSVPKSTQDALSAALDREPTADDWRWAPAPAGYVREDVPAAELMRLVRDVHPRVPGARDSLDPILARRRQDGSMVIVAGAGVAAYLVRKRVRDIPIHVLTGD